MVRKPTNNPDMVLRHLRFARKHTNLYRGLLEQEMIEIGCCPKEERIHMQLQGKGKRVFGV